MKSSAVVFLYAKKQWQLFQTISVNAPIHDVLQVCRPIETLVTKKRDRFFKDQVNLLIPTLAGMVAFLLVFVFAETERQQSCSWSRECN